MLGLCLSLFNEVVYMKLDGEFPLVCQLLVALVVAAGTLKRIPRISDYGFVRRVNGIASTKILSCPGVLS